MCLCSVTFAERKGGDRCESIWLRVETANLLKGSEVPAKQLSFYTVEFGFYDFPPGCSLFKYSDDLEIVHFYRSAYC